LWKQGVRLLKMPQLVHCPVCQKAGYTDERHQIDGGWPCAKHYMEIIKGSKKVWSWNITNETTD